MKYVINLVKTTKIFIIAMIVTMPYTVFAKIDKVSCGDSSSNYLKCVPKKIPSLTSKAFLVIEVAVPIIIIIFGSIDLIKAITAGKEDEIKKAQGIVIKRLITGAIVFFIFVIIKLVVNIVEENPNGIVNCMDCFINNKCKTCKQ